MFFDGSTVVYSLLKQVEYSRQSHLFYADDAKQKPSQKILKISGVLDFCKTPLTFLFTFEIYYYVFVSLISGSKS